MDTTGLRDGERVDWHSTSGSGAESEASEEPKRPPGHLKSRYRGVSRGGDQKWRVRVHLHGRQFHVGRFTDEVTAARAYDNALLYLIGETATFNFGKESALRNKTPLAPRLAKAIQEMCTPAVHVPRAGSLTQSNTTSEATLLFHQYSGHFSAARSASLYPTAASQNPAESGPLPLPLIRSYSAVTHSTGAGPSTTTKFNSPTAALASAAAAGSSGRAGTGGPFQGGRTLSQTQGRTNSLDLPSTGFGSLPPGLHLLAQEACDLLGLAATSQGAPPADAASRGRAGEASPPAAKRARSETLGAALRHMESTQGSTATGQLRGPLGPTAASGLGFPQGWATDGFAQGRLAGSGGPLDVKEGGIPNALADLDPGIWAGIFTMAGTAGTALGGGGEKETQPSSAVALSNAAEQTVLAAWEAEVAAAVADRVGGSDSQGLEEAGPLMGAAEAGIGAAGLPRPPGMSPELHSAGPSGSGGLGQGAAGATAVGAGLQQQEQEQGGSQSAAEAAAGRVLANLLLSSLLTPDPGQQHQQEGGSAGMSVLQKYQAAKAGCKAAMEQLKGTLQAAKQAQARVLAAEVQLFIEVQGKLHSFLQQQQHHQQQQEQGGLAGPSSTEPAATAAAAVLGQAGIGGMYLQRAAAAVKELRAALEAGKGAACTANPPSQQQQQQHQQQQQQQHHLHKQCLLQLLQLQQQQLGDQALVAASILGGGAPTPASAPLAPLSRTGPGASGSGKGLMETLD